MSVHRPKHNKHFSRKSPKPRPLHSLYDWQIRNLTRSADKGAAPVAILSVAVWAATVDGGAAPDIVIGTCTSFDAAANHAALDAIMAECARNITSPT